MKKHITSAKSAGLLGFLRLNRSFVIQYFVFVVSFLFGVFTVLFDFAYNDGRFAGMISGLSGSGYFSNFISYFAVNTFISSVIFVFSFFAFGTPFTEMIFSVFGLGVGCSFASVCRTYGFKGIMINDSVFLLPSLLMFFIFVFLMSASASVSNGFAVIAFGRRTVNDINTKVKDMLIMFLIAELLISVVSALRALLIFVLPGLLVS